MARPLEPGGRRRRKRKIGRKILFVLALGFGLWYAYTDLWPVVRGRVGLPEPLPPIEAEIPAESDDESPALTVEPTDSSSLSGRPTTRRRVGFPNDSRREASEAVDMAAQRSEVDSVTQAGILDRVFAWFGDRLNTAFQVREIRLRGERTLDRASLLAELDTLRGKPLLPLNPPALAESLSAHPRIRRATIGKQLPGTVTITLEERREVAIALHNGIARGMDADRMLLPLPDGAWPLDLPVVTGLRDSVEVGQRLNSPGAAVAASWLDEAGRLPRVHAWLSEIQVAGDSVHCLIGRDGRTLRTGSHAVTAQAATLDALLAEEAGEPAGRWIDLSFAEYVIVRDEPWIDTHESSTGR